MTTMSETIKRTFLYNFLINPSYRIWRHIIAILGVSVIAINSTYITFQPNIDALGNTIFLIFLCSVIVIVCIGYFNIYVLVPKYLLKKKYTIYICSLILSASLMVLSGLLIEYIVYSYMDLPHERTSYFNMVSVLDILSNITMNSLCIAGISMTILLRHWMIEDAHINELEKRHIQSEVERLKEQANPQFLSNILNRASSLTKSDPAKASDMLYKLSQLLRYQLYDCSREKVLLTSEINYLKNYLALEQQYSNAFEYKVESKGDINRVFVATLLFIPFVHGVIEGIYGSDIQPAIINLNFKVDKNNVFFTIHSGSIRKNQVSGYSGIIQRLSILYPDRYALTVEDGHINLELKINQSATKDL